METVDEKVRMMEKCRVLEA